MLSEKEKITRRELLRRGAICTLALALPACRIGRTREPARETKPAPVKVYGDRSAIYLTVLKPETFYMHITQNDHTLMDAVFRFVWPGRI